MPTYNPDQQFKLYDHTGKIIASGSMSCVTEHILDSRARSDSLALLDAAAYALGVMERQELEAQKLTEQKVRTLCDSAARLAIRFDAFEQRRMARQRADEEEERRQIQAMLDALPNPDLPDPFSPSGEMHGIPASQPEDQQQLQQSDQGSLPRELALEGEGPLDPPSELGAPETPAQRAPVAVSLNEQ